MLMGKDTLGYVLQVLVRCCAINFDNRNLKEEGKLRDIRNTIDAFEFMRFEIV